MTARPFLPSVPAPADARYEIERKLGEGTAGAVYLVRDRETGEQLALKKLFRVDAKTVLRLKREFRSLQAFNHPHIIKLYDMGQSGDSWFLTMEYLDGVDLTSYLHAEPRTRIHGTSAGPPIDSTVSASARVLPAFRQLARGIQALHDAGMLHRDLKPKNVLVVDHRVVVLDFGLVRDLSVGVATLTEDGSVAGTPAYMAPEQIQANELSAASDWYAFGVMLYEAVSGVLPVDGPMMAILRAKLECDPTPLEQLVPDVPRWLSELCNALLRRDPAKRPSGEEVLGRLEAGQPSLLLQPTSTENLLRADGDVRRVANELFGRSNETKRLWSALAQAEEGNLVVVHVRGPSGTGKSALVEHFLEQIERRGSVAGRSDALVLRSRCYELEAMPFKALDGVMDALARHLMPLDDFEVGHLLPIDAPALARVFPVLEQLRAVKRLAVPKAPQDALQSRRRAEIALRALLENLAGQTPVVLWIDDLHWGDLDSARILRNWLLQPSAAPILLLFSYRSDEVATSTSLQVLLQEHTEHTPRAAEHTIDVAPLGNADIHALCEPHLGAQVPDRADVIERVVREAQGSPFLASQLIALAEAKSARGDTDLHTLSLDLMIAQTSRMLADDAKKLLALLAVAGRPMAPKLALSAAGVKHGGRALVRDLRGLNLVRTREVAGERMLEVYHDRVRESVRSTLSSDDSRTLHANLFHTLERSGQTEPDWLHTLALGAGLDDRALHYGNAAAERANASLAFERAAGLYKKCIEIALVSERGALWSKLSLALARCSRGAEAAGAYLEAAKYGPQDEAVSWILRAASHFLRCGHFAQGDALVRRVLEAKKIDVPASESGLTAAIAWDRTLIRLRGTHDVLRAGPDFPVELLQRFDLLMSLYLANHAYDPLRAGLFQLRAMRCALEAGEPKRLARALCSASVAEALYGSKHAARESDALLSRATAVNAQLPDADPKAICVARTINAFWLGRMNVVLEAASDVERLFRADSQDDPSGNYHSRFAVASVRLGALHFFAEYKQFADALRSLLDEATATDNRSALLALTRSQTLLEQIEGRAAKSRARLDAQRAELPSNCFGTLHVLHMVAAMSDVCWSGDYAAASEHLAQAWSRFLRSPVRRGGFVGFMAHSQHAQLLLNQYVATGRRGDPARSIRKDLAALKALPLPIAVPAATRYRARLAWLAGDEQTAIAQLRACAAAYRQAGMRHEVARDEYALGVLLQGDEGLALRTTAEQQMREMGVIDVPADLRAHFPELFEIGRV
jgi:serine/threonine protein kinase